MKKSKRQWTIFYRADVTDGLFHDKWLMKDGKPHSQHFTIGAITDSDYEYLLKQWIQNPKARQQYIKSATGIINNLVYHTWTRGLLYVVDAIYRHRLEQLSCYLPGILALGASTLSDTELPPKQKEIHRWAAHGLAYTCVISYEDQKSALGPDQIRMPGNGRRWMELIDEWESEGRNCDLPPGMGEPELERDSAKRYYFSPHPNHLLRPEVKAKSAIFIYIPIT